jgi:hypothetical protein
MQETHKGTSFAGTPYQIVSFRDIRFGGFGKGAHVIYQSAHEFSFTLNPRVVPWGALSSSGGSHNWFGISESTLFSGEAGRSSTWRVKGYSADLFKPQFRSQECVLMESAKRLIAGSYVR